MKEEAKGGVNRSWSPQRCSLNPRTHTLPTCPTIKQPTHLLMASLQKEKKHTHCAHLMWLGVFSLLLHDWDLRSSEEDQMNATAVPHRCSFKLTFLRVILIPNNQCGWLAAGFSETLASADVFSQWITSCLLNHAWSKPTSHYLERTGWKNGESIKWIE